MENPLIFFVKKQELEHCNEEIRDLEKKKEEISVEIRRKFEVEWKVNFASWDQLDINWDSVLINCVVPILTFTTYQAYQLYLVHGLPTDHRLSTSSPYVSHHQCYYPPSHRSRRIDGESE